MAIVSRKRGATRKRGVREMRDGAFTKAAIPVAAVAVAVAIAFKAGKIGAGGGSQPPPADAPCDMAPREGWRPAPGGQPQSAKEVKPATSMPVAPPRPYDAGSAPTADAPRPGAEPQRLAGDDSPHQGQSQDAAARRDDSPNQRAPVFDNPVESQLEVVSRDGFQSIVAPRVNLPQEDILEILRRPVEIYDDDDDETVAAKERTAGMKAEALAFIEAGGTLNQFLRDCQTEANEAQETVRDVREEMMRIFVKEGQEAAEAYLRGANPQLVEMGLPEVRIGRGTIRAMERRREKDAEK